MMAAWVSRVQGVEGGEGQAEKNHTVSALLQKLNGPSEAAELVCYVMQGLRVVEMQPMTLPRSTGRGGES